MHVWGRGWRKVGGHVPGLSSDWEPLCNFVIRDWSCQVPCVQGDDQHPCQPLRLTETSVGPGGSCGCLVRNGWFLCFGLGVGLWTWLWPHWSQDFYPAELRANQDQQCREARADQGTGVALPTPWLKSLLTSQAGRAHSMLHCVCGFKQKLVLRAYTENISNNPWNGKQTCYWRREWEVDSRVIVILSGFIGEGRGIKKTEIKGLGWNEFSCVIPFFLCLQFTPGNEPMGAQRHCSSFPFVLFVCVWQVCLQFPKGFFLNPEEYELRRGRRETRREGISVFWRQEVAPQERRRCSVSVLLFKEADGMDGTSFIKCGFYRASPCPAWGNHALEN